VSLLVSCKCVCFFWVCLTVFFPLIFILLGAFRLVGSPEGDLQAECLSVAIEGLGMGMFEGFDRWPGRRDGHILPMGAPVSTDQKTVEEVL